VVETEFIEEVENEEVELKMMVAATDGGTERGDRDGGVGGYGDGGCERFFLWGDFVLG